MQVQAEDSQGLPEATRSQGKARHRPTPEPSETPGPGGALISDFWPPEERLPFCLKPFGLWPFVMAATGLQQFPKASVASGRLDQGAQTARRGHFWLEAWIDRGICFTSLNMSQT